MPILRGLVPVTPADPGDDLPTRRVIDPPGVYQPTWHAPDGTVLHLNPPGSEFFSLKANSGLGAVPVEHLTVDAPDGGVIVEATRPRERTILWPVRIRASQHMNLIARWRQVVRAFTQTRDLGPGRLRIRRPDGEEREILAYYSSGLEGEPEDGTWLQVTAVINLLCPDPFWRGSTQIVQDFRDEPQLDYLDDYPSVSTAQVIGTVRLRNDGHRAAWPEWTIRGPMTELTATNGTRGESFTLTHTLAAGEAITITSRPIQVRGPAGENLISALDLTGGGGKPWRLDAGTVSDVTFAVADSEPDSTPGADDGTRLRLAYWTDYETA